MTQKTKLIYFILQINDKILENYLMHQKVKSLKLTTIFFVIFPYHLSAKLNK